MVATGICAEAGGGAEADGAMGGGEAAEEDLAASEKVVPEERSTSLRRAIFPLKNSDAERDASDEGAGGKMSDWKESACD